MFKDAYLYGYQTHKILMKQHPTNLTDSQLLAVVVHVANVHDSKGASDVIALLRGRFSRLVKILADGGYRGVLIENTKATFG